jgi:hypothetical protein
VGADTRSYAPVFAASEIEALTIAEEITATLAHFPTLEVRVEPVGPADAVMVPAETELELHGNRPTLHVSMRITREPLAASRSTLRTQWLRSICLLCRTASSATAVCASSG